VESQTESYTMRIISRDWYSLTNEWTSQKEYLENQSDYPTCIFCGKTVDLAETHNKNLRVQRFGPPPAPVYERWYSHYSDNHYIRATNKYYYTKVRCWWPR